jgi:hypothetical protein
MESTVRLYSSKIGEISKFLNKFYNEEQNINKKVLEWEKSYPNPVELADIIGALIENNDKFDINMWISIDKGLFVNVTDYNADEIIRYLYERFPW